MTACSPGMHTAYSYFWVLLLVFLTSLFIPNTCGVNPCVTLPADDQFWYVEYPEQNDFYESNSQACWTIYGYNDGSVQMDMVKLDVGTGNAGSDSCMGDFLEITDGMPDGVKAKLCGSWDPSGLSFTSTGDVFYIRFVSGPQTRRHTGFRFKYRNAVPGTGAQDADNGNRRLLGIIISIPILILLLTVCALSCRHAWRHGGRSSRNPWSLLYRGGREVAPEQHVHVNVINAPPAQPLQPPPYTARPPAYPGPPLPQPGGACKTASYPAWAGTTPPQGGPTPGYGQPLSPAYAATGHGVQPQFAVADPYGGMPGVEDAAITSPRF